MRLHEWQHRFQDVLLDASSVTDVPLKMQGLSRELSMGIYANAYRERLHEALRSNYPALYRLLGDDDFAPLAYAFTAACPSQEVSIRWFGAALPDYLRATEPYSRCPAIAELAQFEWALRHTVDAADAARIGVEDLRALDAEQWPALRCAVHPSLSILKFEWNAPRIWRALNGREAPPAPERLSSYWLVYRGADLTSEWRSADAIEAEAIQLWTRSKNFSEICELLAERIGDTDVAIARAASFMRTWIEQGLLTHTSFEEKNNAHAH